MIKDHVFKYYIGQNKSCSESLFLAACEDRNIPVPLVQLSSPCAPAGWTWMPTEIRRCGKR